VNLRSDLAAALRIDDPRVVGLREPIDRTVARRQRRYHRVARSGRDHLPAGGRKAADGSTFRPGGRALAFAERVLFLERGRLLLDAARDEALAWLEEHRPAYLPPEAPEPLPPTNGGGPVVALDGVTFSYVPGAPVLTGATLDVHRGEVVALMGPNGSGKTTLAKIAAGLLQPESGSLLRPKRAGYLSQDPGRYVVRERTDDEVALAVHGDRERARAALEAFGLAWAAARHPRDLSSGERERLALAAVAVSEPDLLVLDEPTRGMDPERKAAAADWIERYAAAGRGVLVVTHDATLPAHRRVELAAVELTVA
jgi:energy-coupling factor transport system ATP-binding protein